jgi:hypothetical protein
MTITPVETIGMETRAPLLRVSVKIDAAIPRWVETESGADRVRGLGAGSGRLEWIGPAAGGTGRSWTGPAAGGYGTLADRPPGRGRSPVLELVRGERRLRPSPVFDVRP